MHNFLDKMWKFIERLVYYRERERDLTLMKSSNNNELD